MHEKLHPLVMIIFQELRRRADQSFDSRYRNAKRNWKYLHSPIDGGYICAICEQFIPKKELTIDHIVRWTDVPELRLDPRNFQPAHKECNTFRGRLMEDPKFLMEMRSLPESHPQRQITERILAQAKQAYAEWELQKRAGSA